MADIKAPLLPMEPPPAYDSSNGSVTPQPRKPSLRAPLPLDLPYLTNLHGRRIILASASPRRKQLLAQILPTPVAIIPSTVPENIPKASLSPFEYVLKTATQKASHVYQLEINNSIGEPALLIAADTIVVSPTTGTIYEKPRSEADHVAMLKTLRKEGIHKVLTAVVVMAPLPSARDPGYIIESAVEETIVRFAKETSDEVLLSYVKTREGADKAGGYGIQGIGSVLVEGIEGSWDNVVGLPIRPLLGLIEKVHAAVLEDEGAEEEIVGVEHGFEEL